MLHLFRPCSFRLLPAALNVRAAEVGGRGFRYSVRPTLPGAQFGDSAVTPCVSAPFKLGSQCTPSWPSNGEAGTGRRSLLGGVGRQGGYYGPLPWTSNRIAQQTSRSTGMWRRGNLWIMCYPPRLFRRSHKRVVESVIGTPPVGWAPRGGRVPRRASWLGFLFVISAGSFVASTPFVLPGA